MDVLNLSVRFIAEQNDIPVSDVSTQTGDFLPINLFILAIAFMGVIIFSVIVYRRMTIKSSVCSGPNLERTEINTALKFVLLICGILFLTGFFVTCFWTSANASVNENPLKPDKDCINVIVAEDGSFSCDTANLTNVSKGRFTVEKSYVKLNDDVKSVEGLEDTYLSIRGFDGVLYEGQPNGVEYIPTGLTSLLPSEITPLNFALDLSNVSNLWKLIDKNVFDITLVPKNDFPVHDSLEQYSWPEIKIVADSFSDNTIPESESIRFRNFASQGQTKILPIGGHDNVTEDYLFMRIIGINHDEVAGVANKKAGLTFMSANSIDKAYYYEWDGGGDRVYSTNWGESRLCSNMSNGEIYNLLNKALTSVSVSPVTVTKLYATGWPNPQSPFYDWENLLTKNEQFFLPSYYEVEGKNDVYSGIEGTPYEYISNDPWVNIQGCVWHDQQYGYRGRGPAMNFINWKGFQFFMTSGSELLKTRAIDTINPLNEVGGIVSTSGGSSLFNMGRSVSTYRDSRYPSSDYVLSIGILGNSDNNCAVNSTVPIAPCFCL